MLQAMLAISGERLGALTDELGRALRGGLLHFLRLPLIANNTN